MCTSTTRIQDRLLPKRVSSYSRASASSTIDEITTTDVPHMEQAEEPFPYNGNDHVNAATKKPYSHRKLFALASGFLGIQICWAVQIGYVSKFLLELGLSQRFVSYAWLAGPIAGIIVQPIVGKMSDRCTSRFGRRRPFLLAGSFFCIICLSTFSYAGELGTLLGDPIEPADEFVVKPRAISIAITSFWALDFSINAAQGPLRALLSDVIPPTQQNTGNAYFAFATGMGNLTGSLLGSFQLSKYFPFFREDIQALYAFAALILLVTMSFTVFFTKEVPLQPSASPSIPTPFLRAHSSPNGSYESLNETTLLAALNAPATNASTHLSFIDAVRLAPYPFWRTFAVQCFTWYGWFSMFVFATSWMGAEVYNGSFSSPKGTPERDLYDAGVRMGNFGFALQSVVTMLVAGILPTLISRTSSYFVYLIASLSFAVALSCTVLLTEAWQAQIAVILFASTGFTWAVTMTIPWALMGEAVSKTAAQHAGMYFTMFNLSQCFPEIAVSLVAEEVIRATHKQSSVLALGGISVFIAAAIIIVLAVGKPSEESEQE